MDQCIKKPHKLYIRMRANSLAHYLAWYEGWLDAYNEPSEHADMALIRSRLLQTAALVASTKRDIKERMGL